MSDAYDVEETLSLGNDLDIDLRPSSTSELKSTVLDHLNTIEKTGYSVRFQRLYEVHGQWNNQKPDDASLLAIKMTPRVVNPRDHFKSLNIIMTLILPNGIRGNHEAPYFSSYEPGQEGAWFMNEVSHTVTINKGGEANIGGQLPVGADLGLTFSKSKSEEFQSRRILKVEAKEDWSATENANRKRTDRIRWTVTPADQSDGIGDYFVIAFLVRRSRETKFRIRVESEASISVFKDSVNDLLSWGRKATLGDFGPASAPNQLKPSGVEETNLERVARQNILRNIAGVHIPERVAAKSVYNVADEKNATTSTTTPLAAGTPVMLSPNVQVAAGNAGVQLAPGPVIGTPPVIASIASSATRGSAYLACQMQSEQEILVAANSRSRGDKRAVRHRRMAALYRRLAQLHMEEAEDIDGIPSMESYANEAERQEYV
ncbi:hypothetical protein F5Y14DRAFT_463234 [Nemania sp. NC0429]|nr:hypothetical protein F5Y14DRAFT_463234 [Nemania sp. NC0429]